MSIKINQNGHVKNNKTPGSDRTVRFFDDESQNLNGSKNDSKNLGGLKTSIKNDSPRIPYGPENVSRYIGGQKISFMKSPPLVSQESKMNTLAFQNDHNYGQKNNHDHLKREGKVLWKEKKRISFGTDETSDSIIDVTRDFECLRMSVMSKASRVSGGFNEVTLGPHSKSDLTAPSDSRTEEQSEKQDPSLNESSSHASGIKFSKKKILLENELQRQEQIRKVVNKKCRDMEDFCKKLQEEVNQVLSMKSLQREKEAEQKLASYVANEEQAALKDETDRKNEAHKLRLEESEEIFKKISPIKTKLDGKFNDFHQMSKLCKDENSAEQKLIEYAACLQNLQLQMAGLMQKAQAGDLTKSDLYIANAISLGTTAVSDAFQADIDRINATYDEEIIKREQALKEAEQEAAKETLRLKQIEDEENAAKLSQKQQQAQAEQSIQQQQQPSTTQLEGQQSSQVDGSVTQPPPPQYPGRTGPDPVSSIDASAQGQKQEEIRYVDVESYQIYLESCKYLENYASTYQDFLRSDAMKKFKFECQKTLNITINAISQTSREQLIDKYNKLKSFLSGKGSPNILLNPQAEAYSKNLLAHKIVDQGDTSISSKPELAFPFAAIIVALWNDWPDLGLLIKARFHTVSPFFVPVFLSPEDHQSEKDYYKALGCKFNVDGSSEKPEQFLKRLGGIMYLYASIMVTKQRQGITKAHPYGIGNAWRWLAATVNTEPRCDIADICATLIYVLLEITGNDLWRAYPNQFPKLLTILHNSYYTKLKNFDPVISAPISRLGDFLVTAIQKGTIPPPKGQLPSNFW
ncbi:hypothetical protein QAD02_017192 [Eretmocerus hayati]|uniref:Uncharacterized protein n=1 Tax=Eretmocerus hayati TaxID=131215 RepID=A0ACC2PI09_9HYME|nr:hypothetical protein QAD02_017192 [Eretmocerus hayati]